MNWSPVDGRIRDGNSLIIENENSVGSLMEIRTSMQQFSRPVRRLPLRREPHRRGSVLLIILVLVTMLALGVYTFTEVSITEARATAMFGRGVQTRSFAESGVSVTLALLGSPIEETGGDFYDLPEFFQGVLLREADTARGRGRFSVVSPLENDSSASSVRFGLVDESGRLNVNKIVEFGLDEEQSRELLLYLPDMTLDIADAILDWIDDDIKTRQHGAEDNYYSSLPEPYYAANAPLESLDELLLIRDMTPVLLYGEDQNRNGLLEPSEDDGDGIIQRGWSTYLTVFSREANRRSDGSARINLNQESLADLFDELEQEFDEDTARFVTAYRMNGSNQSQQNGRTSSSASEAGQTESSQTSSETNSSVEGGSPEQSNAESTSEAQGGGSGSSEEGEKVTRGGMDLSAGAKVTIKTIYELIDVQVEATVNNGRASLVSPWSSDSARMREYLPDVTDKLSITADEMIMGRINVNRCSREVLSGLPGMTEEIANNIVGTRVIGSSGQQLSNALDSHATTAWLMNEGVLTLEQMRALDPYVTARGDAYRAQVVGYFDEGGPITRLEVVVDAVKQPPEILFQRDLSDLGTGYSNIQYLSDLD